MIRLINVLKKYFQPNASILTDKETVQPGSIYGVGAGKYTGKFFVYIEQNDKVKCFLTLPDMQPQEITDEKFNIGVDNKIMEFQEVLPNKVYKVCKQQYDDAKKKSNN